MNESEVLSQEALAGKYFRRVYNFCRTMLRNEWEVEEACQEVFLTVARRRAELVRVRRLTPWILKIALLTCLYIRRRRGRNLPSISEVDSEDLYEATPPLDTSEELGRVLEALDRLPERYQAVLTLHYQQGLSHEESAEALGVSRGALRVLLHRAVMRLRQEVRKR